MSSVTVFNDLPDLVLLELFSYLSSTDILWGWVFLNNRLTSLITELGFFCHVNLSSTHRHQFDTILRRIPLNKIESLIIDNDASSVQLSQWPHLPRLMTLKLRGVRKLEDVSSFVLLHATTLTHLTFYSCNYFTTTGSSLDFDSRCKFSTLVTDVLLRQLPVLRLLDLGTNALVYSLKNWHATSVSISLTYLRVSLDSLNDVLLILSTRSLSDTLKQLHISIEDPASYPSLDSLTPLCMIHLHTFTFATPLCSRFHNEKWTFVEKITSSNIMPVLRRINLAMILSVDHLIHLNQMSLFVDDRYVDVHFAFSVNDRAKHAQLSKYIPHGTRFHKRQVVGATFINNVLFENLEIVPIDLAYQSRQHVWYTIPWAFNEFKLYVPDPCIIQMQVFPPSPMTIATSPSRLTTFHLSGEVLPPHIFSFPHIIADNRIDTLRVQEFDRPFTMVLPVLRHIVITDQLNYCPLSASVRSIHIMSYYDSSTGVMPNWNLLRALSALPFLKSLHIVVYDIPFMLDDQTCQIITESVLMLTDFVFCFRRHRDEHYNVNKVFDQHRIFIQQLHNRILALSQDKQPYVILESDGCGLTIWF